MHPMFLQEHFEVQCCTDILMRTQLNLTETISYEDCIFSFEAAPRSCGGPSA